MQCDLLVPICEILLLQETAGHDEAGVQGTLEHGTGTLLSPGLLAMNAAHPAH